VWPPGRHIGSTARGWWPTTAALTLRHVACCRPCLCPGCRREDAAMSTPVATSMVVPTRPRWSGSLSAAPSERGIPWLYGSTLRKGRRAARQRSGQFRRREVACPHGRESAYSSVWTSEHPRESNGNGGKARRRSGQSRCLAQTVAEAPAPELDSGDSPKARLEELFRPPRKMLVALTVAGGVSTAWLTGYEQCWQWHVFSPPLAPFWCVMWRTV